MKVVVSTSLEAPAVTEYRFVSSYAGSECSRAAGVFPRMREPICLFDLSAGKEVTSELPSTLKLLIFHLIAFQGLTVCSETRLEQLPLMGSGVCGRIPSGALSSGVGARSTPSG